jgi:hypothetical protein
MAKYKLLIKKENPKKVIDDNKEQLSFSVVDLQKGVYPFNWVCKLPKDCSGLFRRSRFSQLFKEEDSAEFAVKLLTRARRECDDIAIRQEIDSRLSKIRAYTSSKQTLNNTTST